MRTTFLLSSATLLGLLLSFGFAEETQPLKGTAKPTTFPKTKVDTKPIIKVVDKTANSPQLADKRSPDEEAIRATNESLVKAFGVGNAKLIAAHFTPDAEYVDEAGTVFQGREAIEESLTAYFTANTDCELTMSVDSIRFITPGVAIEDGSSTITHKNCENANPVRYTTVHVKTEGKWLVASVRDYAPKNRIQHRTQLQQLDWLLGDWIDEGDDSLVIFSCQVVDDGNFLLRKFTVMVAGQEAMSGTQRIGWDPITGRLRTWIFDSAGGYGEGLWHRDGEKWVLKSTGLTAEGQSASSTSIYTYVNEHTMTWQSVHHEIAGVQFPDSEVVTIVRQAPVPTPGITKDSK